MKTYIFKAVFFILFFIGPLFSAAQTATWNYRVNSGNLGTTYSWIDCSGGTALDLGNLQNGDLDDGRWRINWPFNFTYYDDAYTTSNRLSICTNGFIRFDANADFGGWTSARDYILDATPSTNFGQILCYGISDCNFSDANSNVHYLVTGVAPNRVFTIEFQDMGFYWAPNTYGDVEVSFYETTNRIVLKVGTNNVTYAGAELGLHSGVSPYFHSWQDIDNSAENTWIEYIPTVSTTNDQTSVAHPPTSQPSVTNFPTTAIGQGTAHDVLNFSIVDAGGDGQPTKISKIRIKNAHPVNEATWSNCISGVVLNDGTNDLNVGVTTIDDEYIDFLFNIDAFDVPEGGSTDLTLKVYLTPGAPIEGQTLQFYIDDNNHDWYHDQMGSGFAANFGNSGNITSNVFTFLTVASELRFTVNPPSVVSQNTVISPTVTVSATDASGTVDANYTGTITLNNSGSITWLNNSVAAVNGIAAFTSLQFSATGGPITMSTTNVDGLTEATSTEFSVAYTTVLFSDDFETPAQSLIDWTVSGTSGIWELGNQTNDAFGPPSGHSANGVFGTVLNANYGLDGVDAYLDCPIIDLAGTANPKVKFWIDMESEAAWDGGTVQIRVKPDAASPWGGYTTIDLSDVGYSGKVPNDTDVNGLANNEDGWSGITPSGEWSQVVIDLFNLTTPGLTNITANSLIQVRFWFGTDGATNNFPGWYIDDFEVSFISFPGLWSTAAATTDWNTGSNWDDGIVPSGIFVTIPDGAANYPLLNNTANASSILIQDGGQLAVTTGSNLVITQNLIVGEGVSGGFSMDGGTFTIGGNLFSENGSTILLSGGDLTMTNWAQNSSSDLALGNIALSGGTITAAGNVKFADVNVAGTMSGMFTLNVGGDFYNSNSTWTTPTGGTIVLQGTSASILGTTTGNSSVMYNLTIENTGGVILNGASIIENNCEIASGSNLDIVVSSPMTVKGDMMLHADDKNRASIIDNMNLTVTGSSNVELYTSANAYHYISSPLSAVPKTKFSIAPWGANNPNFYSYDESSANADWAYGWISPSSANLAIGLGYAYFLTQNYVHTLTGGNFNTGNISVPVTNSANGGAANTWNLIGNPYPSPIDANAFILANSDADPAVGLLTGTLYFWDDDASGGAGYNSADYSTYNRAGAVSGGNGNVVNGFISIGQSFFVKTNFNGNVAFTNSLRTSTPGIFFKTSGKPVHQKLLLSLENSQNDYNETLIAFLNDATDGFDNMYDGEKIKGNSNIAFYSKLGDKDFAIQAFAALNGSTDTSKTIKLGLTTALNETFSIRVNNIDNFPKEIDIFLVDNQLNTVTNLKETTSYSFSANSGIIDDRFELRFDYKAVIDGDVTDVEIIKPSMDDNFNIYSFENVIHLKIPDKYMKGEIRVYNLNGSEIYNTNITSNSMDIRIEKINGIVIVKAKAGDNVLSEKVYLRNK